MIRWHQKASRLSYAQVALCVVWGQSAEVLSETAPVSAFLLVPGITWASGRRWSGRGECLGDSGPARGRGVPGKAARWPTTDGPQRPSHRKMLILLLWLFFLLFSGEPTPVKLGCRPLQEGLSGEHIQQMAPCRPPCRGLLDGWSARPRDAPPRVALTCDPASSDGPRSGGLNGDGRLERGTFPLYLSGEGWNGTKKAPHFGFHTTVALMLLAINRSFDIVALVDVRGVTCCC